MSHAPRQAIGWAAIIACLSVVAACGTSSPKPAAVHHSVPPGIAAPEVRVNQVGYTPASPKAAFAMLTKPASSVDFTVSGGGATVHGVSHTDLGRWNSHYPAVFQLTFSGLTHTGRYRVSIDAHGMTATSPSFQVASPAALYHTDVLNSVRYFTSERDGPDVVHSVLNREPANLTDENASVFATPQLYTSGPNQDSLNGNFHKVGGPVNVAGGWFDAGGGYEKFAYTSSYADALMLIAARDAPGQYATLPSEAQYGLSWLEKLWNPAQKVLYAQVGFGNGNPSGSIQGDYNFWFLPQAEDHLNVSPSGNPGPSGYYVRNRPVFYAAPPGQQISPDLAGRFAADYALGAQLDAAKDPATAAHLMAAARGIYAMAKTSNVGQILTTFPYDYYPGTEWKSDMAWGAAEMVLADEAMHAPATQVASDLKAAASWAQAYIAQGHHAGGDTFNLYDNGAIAEGELLRAMRHTSVTSPISASALVSDLAAQLRVGETWAKGDPFELGTQLGQNDASPHAFGLYITNALYQEYGGSDVYRAFAQQQLNFALGGNAWGSSFVVGDGTTFPHCMQSEIANLAGSLNGRGDIQLGATVDGPSSPGNFSGLGPMAPIKGLGTPNGMRRCWAGAYAQYNTPAAAYSDNVSDWPSVEPALDYSAAPLLAFTLAGQGLG